MTQLQPASYVGTVQTQNFKIGSSFLFIQILQNPPLQFNYNHFQNILRLFDDLPKFTFTTSETMHDYYL